MAAVTTDLQRDLWACSSSVPQFSLWMGPAEPSLSPADTLARYTLSGAGEETESQGHSEHCGSATCKVWGKTQHQGGKSPTERAICHRTGPDCLLLALTASHSGATWTQGQELLLPGDRHQTSLFIVGLQQPRLWDHSDYSHAPAAEEGPLAAWPGTSLDLQSHSRGLAPLSSTQE